MSRLSSLCNRCYPYASVKVKPVLVCFVLVFKALLLLFLFYIVCHFIHLKAFYKTVQEGVTPLMGTLSHAGIATQTPPCLQ